MRRRCLLKSSASATDGCSAFRSAIPGIRPGDRIVARRHALHSGWTEMVGASSTARPAYRWSWSSTSENRHRLPASLHPLARSPIAESMGTGVRAIDAILTCGRGQRVGLFGGSGVGKSTLLGMMARGTQADVVVLALVGERGREVRCSSSTTSDPRVSSVPSVDGVHLRTARRCYACAPPTVRRPSRNTSARLVATCC